MGKGSFETPRGLASTWDTHLSVSPWFSQRFGDGEEEAAYMPHCWLWQGVREDVSPPSPPALAQRREALRLQLDVLRKEIHQE